MNNQLMNKQAWLLTSCYRAITSPITQINVAYVPTEDILGTYDGETWSLNQDTPDDDEKGLHGRESR
jgi:hypothetical protein